MYKLLRDRWAKGALSSADVQQFAAAAEHSGAVGVEALAKIAAKGKWPSNAQRDLQRALGRPQGSPEIYMTAIPVQDKEGNPTVIQHPFVLPHELFSQLHAEREDMFLQCVRGDDKERNLLWHQLGKLPVIQKHPTLKSEDLSSMVPVGLHGDGGKFSHTDSLFVVTWNSLVGQGTTAEQRFIITVIRKQQLLPDGSTLAAIFNVVSWSLNSLLVGRWPSTDEHGAPISKKGGQLAGKWKGAFVQIRGDWQFFSQALNFPQWNSSLRMCWLCKASNTLEHLFWTNFNDDAPWLETLWSHESYLADLAEKGEDPPALFSITGFRLECVMVDVLHTVDQGIASHIIGNIFVEVLGQLGQNRSQRLRVLNDRILDFYKIHKPTSKIQGQLSMEQLRSTNQWPKLKAKAAATRHLAPLASQLADEFNSGSHHDQLRKIVADSLVQFYVLVQQEDRAISAQARQELPNLCRRLCRAYAHLANESVNAQVMAWKLVPKFHLFCHLCFSQALEFGNPRFFWTYPDEDIVGQMIEAAKSCHQSTLASTALYKFLVLVFRD